MSSPEPSRLARSRRLPRRVYDFLTAPRFALALLVGVLACCVVGVTVFRGERAWALIFSTLWFNALLIVLAITSAAAFFTRIWRRRLTLVSVGMILFHVSFAALLCGVTVNSLFHFKGLMRLTEGETLPNWRVESYDLFTRGRLFDFAWLEGETTLREVHRGYKVDGKDKRVAYEIAVGAGEAKTTGIIYVTQDLEHDGVRYIRSKEGYSVLVVLSDGEGRELYGAHVPLQSIRTGGGNYLYATGSAMGAASFPFPPPPDAPAMELLVSYRPNAVVERQGDVTFQVKPIGGAGTPEAERTGQVPVGGRFDAGDLTLSPREIRYWVGMDVLYQPGLTVILSSLWVGLGGMVLTFLGRIRQGAARTRAARPTSPPEGGGSRGNA